MEKNPLSLEVTSEEVYDGKILKKLVDNASGNNHEKGPSMSLEIVESEGIFKLILDNLAKIGVKTDAGFSGTVPHASIVDPDNNPITIMENRNSFE